MRKVVIISQLPERVEPGREVFVALATGVINSRFKVRRVGLRQLAVGSAEIERSAIARIHPAFRGNGAYEAR